MGLPKELLIFRRLYKNYIQVILAYHRRDKLISVTFRDGRKLNLDPDSIFLINRLIETGMDESRAITCIEDQTIPYKGHLLKIRGSETKGFTIYETFLRGDYKNLDVKDQTVLDVGGNIGDTAIFFLMNGAARVILLEPYPTTFELAVENIKSNKLEDKVVLLNSSYGQDRELVIDEFKIANAGNSLEESEHGKKIREYSLKSLIEKFKIENAVLKMDCEGCEYHLLREPDEWISTFTRIQIEYHYGFVDLVSKLRSAGYEVEFTKPVRIINEHASNPIMSVGFIYAERKL